MIFLGAQVSGKMKDVTSVEDIYMVGRDLTSDSISWITEWMIPRLAVRTLWKRRAILVPSYRLEGNFIANVPGSLLKDTQE